MSGQSTPHPAPVTVEEIGAARGKPPQAKRVTYCLVLKETFGEFFQSTGISGVSNAGHSRHILLAVFWITLSIAASYRTAIDVINVIKDYQSYPYKTQIQVDHRSRAPFPAVTFCNQNRIDCYKIFKTMLLYAENDTETSIQLLRLYQVAQCVEAIGCSEVFEGYSKQFQENNLTLPQYFIEGDPCLKCDKIWSAYKSLCPDDNQRGGGGGGKESDKSEKLQTLDFLWQSMQCSGKERKFDKDDLTSCREDAGSLEGLLNTADQISQIGSAIPDSVDLPTNVTDLEESLKDSIPVDSNLLNTSTPVEIPVNLATEIPTVNLPDLSIVKREDTDLLTTSSSPVIDLLENSKPGISSAVDLAAETLTDTTVPTVNLLETSKSPVSVLGDLTTQALTVDTGPLLNVPETPSPTEITSVVLMQGLTDKPLTETALPDLNVQTTEVLSTEALPEAPIPDIGPKILRRKRQLLDPISSNSLDLSSPTGPIRPPDFGDDDDDGGPDFPRSPPNMEVSEEHDKKMEFLSLYMNLSDAVKQEISYQFEEMIKDCIFLGDNCYDKTIFYQRFFNTYGNCFTFNSRAVFNTSYTGTSYSLSVVLDVMESTYLPRLLTEKAGARIVIHQTYTNPLLDDDGLDAPPGMVSSFAIRERQMVTLPYPYEANCVSTWGNTSYELRANGTKNNHYTTSECLRMCLQRIFVTNCKCIHPLYPQDFTFNGTYYGDPSMKYCNLTSGNESDIQCVISEFKDFSENPKKAGCRCEVACHTVEYPRVVSMSTWPPEPSEDYANAKYKTGLRESSLMKVEVFYNSLSMEQIYQSQVYSTPWDLVSSLGGALSLYMGISVFLMMEVLELFIILIYNSILYCSGRYQSQSETPVPSPQMSTGLVYPVVTPETLGFLQKAGHVVKVSQGPGEYGNPCISARGQKAVAFDKVFHQ
ncbi:uncharacterized protein [Palaemon carinicauda]|uniref:uncharacterized protein n=1 Tax=Palaemon carinicauda TaxID=392227 RepID=UPI0035B5C697